MTNIRRGGGRGYKFYRKVLGNGMTVLFEQRKGCGVVSIAFATRYGSINENPREKGIAHFIEHMLYKGTPTRNAKQISEAIEKKGGILNGFTSEQITAYWCKIPSRHLSIALGVLGDMVKNPLFDEKEIEKERKVILEEMKMCKDAPHIYANDKILSCLYSGTLGMRIIGTEQTIGAMDRIMLNKKFREAYATNNLILCVVGEADFEELCAFAARNFQKTRSSVPRQKITLRNCRKSEKRRGIAQANFVFAHHTPTASEKKCYAAQVLCTIMAEGMSSRLFQEIREKRNLAYAVKGSCNTDKDFGYLSIYIGTSKDNLSKVIKLILEEFKKMKNLGQKEFHEAKEHLIGNNKINKEDSQGQMLELLSYEILGRAKDSYRYENLIRRVKLADVKKLARFRNYSYFSLVPA